jgi:hypothetical protein
VGAAAWLLVDPAAVLRVNDEKVESAAYSSPHS